MSLRRVKDKADSLGLLFDTICNAFGGIIVIAVLVALMSHEIKNDEDSVKAAEASKDIIARRIVHAEEDLTEAQKTLSDLKYKVSSQAPSSATESTLRSNLIKNIQELGAEITSSEAELNSLKQTEAISDPGLKKQELSKQQSTVVEEITSIQQKVTEDGTEIQQLETRSTELESALKKASAPISKNLRLPREHSTGKEAWYIVIKNNELFSKYVLNSGNVEQNSGIFNVQTDGDAETWVPIAGRGISNTDQSTVLQLLSDIHQSGFYPTFLVYDDSFSTFIATRDDANSKGIDYGWVPLEQSDPVIFSSDGTAPKPQ